jgi:transposase-like protein
MTYKEFAATAASAQVRYRNNYVTRLIAERRRRDGKAERMVIACPACQSTSVTRLNFSRARLYGEPLRDQCDSCRHQFLEEEASLLSWPS